MSSPASGMAGSLGLLDNVHGHHAWPPCIAFPQPKNPWDPSSNGHSHCMLSISGLVASIQAAPAIPVSLPAFEAVVPNSWCYPTSISGVVAPETRKFWYMNVNTAGQTTQTYAETFRGARERTSRKRTRGWTTMASPMLVLLASLPDIPLHRWPYSHDAATAKGEVTAHTFRCRSQTRPGYICLLFAVAVVLRAPSLPTKLGICMQAPLATNWHATPAGPWAQLDQSGWSGQAKLGLSE